MNLPVDELKAPGHIQNFFKRDLPFIHHETEFEDMSDRMSLFPQCHPLTADVQPGAAVDQRGDQGMGFSHTMTDHHFHLCFDGGVIEVECNSGMISICGSA
jgi:hypothetical protein